MILLLLATALAADPWGRPAHLRAVAAPPADWGDLSEDRVALRLWWDAGGPPAQVEAQVKGAWRRLADDAQPGWTSGPLPRDTALRVRLGEGVDRRWSEPVTAPPWVGPAALAALSASPHQLLAGMVGSVDLDHATGELWATTLGGGAVRLPASGGAPERLTRWEGLPDDDALAVDAMGGLALIGTANGAALLQDGRVTQVYIDGLSDPYVQSVLLDGPRRYLGTYRGLDRAEGEVITPMARPWSVFSLGLGQPGDLLVGYEGLRRLPRDASWAPVARPEEAPLPTPALLEEGHVYGILDEPAATWLASTDAGLLRSVAGGPAAPVQGYPSDEVYDVERSEQGLWVAAGALGVVGPDGSLWGPGQGLPGSAAWSLAATPTGDLYVGTNAGLARIFPGQAGAELRKKAGRAIAVWPAAPWPAATPLADLLLRADGAFLAGPEGVRVIGAPHKAAGDLVVGAGTGVVALAEDADGVWSFGDRAVRLDRRGRLHQVALPGRALDGVAAAGTVWVGTTDGLLRYDPRADRFVPVTELVEVRRLAPGDLGLWVIARGAVFEVVAGGARPFLRAHPALDLAPVEGAVWLGTEDGLERLLTRGERSGEVEDVLGTGDAGVAVPAVADDGAGGCWFAAADGTVGRVAADGRRGAIRLPGAEPPRPSRIVPFGEDQAWVLTAAGTWLVRVRLGDRPVTGSVTGAVTAPVTGFEAEP